MLTPKQKRLFDFIADFIEREGRSPTFDVMREHIGLASNSGVSTILDSLEERGFVARRHHKHRNVRVLRLPEHASYQPRRFIPIHRCKSCGDVIPVDPTDPVCPRETCACSIPRAA